VYVYFIVNILLLLLLPLSSINKTLRSPRGNLVRDNIAAGRLFPSGRVRWWAPISGAAGFLLGELNRRWRRSALSAAGKTVAAARSLLAVRLRSPAWRAELNAQISLTVNLDSQPAHTPSAHNARKASLTLSSPI
jgi:hypothetical protein